MTDTYQNMALFGVTIENLNKILATALSKGGDYADLYFESSKAYELSLRDGHPGSF